MAMSKFIGGPWHGAVIDVSKEVVVFPAVRSDRHPRQERGFLLTIRYRRVKPGVYRIVEGYYPLPRYVDPETRSALAEQERVRRIVNRAIEQTVSTASVAKAPALTFAAFLKARARVTPSFEIQTSVCIPELDSDGDRLYVSVAGLSWLRSLSGADQVLWMHPNTLDALLADGLDISGVFVHRWEE